MELNHSLVKTDGNTVQKGAVLTVSIFMDYQQMMVHVGEQLLDNHCATNSTGMTPSGSLRVRCP